MGSDVWQMPLNWIGAMPLSRETETNYSTSLITFNKCAFFRSTRISRKIPLIIPLKESGGKESFSINMWQPGKRSFIRKGMGGASRSKLGFDSKTITHRIPIPRSDPLCVEEQRKRKAHLERQKKRYRLMLPSRNKRFFWVKYPKALDQGRVF